VRGCLVQVEKGEKGEQEARPPGPPRHVRLRPLGRLEELDAFLLLAIEAGADSGIVDPVANNIERVFAVDRETAPFRLAADVLTGADRNCRAYLKAYRAGELELPDATAA